jgi:acyl-CoA synthetase (AMP-forming)/AMP-acid ligase II
VSPDSEIRGLASLIRARSARDPAKIAVTDQGQSTTLAALDTRASQVANGLLRAPADGPRVVALLDANTGMFLELLFGAAKAGWAVLPLNWRLAIPELVFMVDDAGAEVLIAGAGFRDAADVLRQTCPALRTVIWLDPAADAGYDGWRDRQDPKDPGMPEDGHAVILHLYTSGTTGRPKAVRLTNANVLASAPSLAGAFGYAPAGDCALVCLPLFHVSGSMWAIACLYAGTPCVVLRTIDPAAILEAIGRFRITKLFLVPTVIRMLLDTDRIRTTDLSSLQLIVYGASPISVPLLTDALAAFRCQFAQVYGLTETTGAITYLQPSDHVLSSRRLRSCGRPLPGVDIRIVDADGHDLPLASVGEIVCRTPQNMHGYWRRDDDTAAVFQGEWLRTGDAGFVDEDGFVYIHDRIKDMVVTGGANVYPAEVEEALIAHPAVADVAVIGIPDERWGEAVAALVVSKPGTAVTPDELIQFAKQRIAAYKAPKSVSFVASLPRNAAGKLLKAELRRPFWTGRDRQVN